MFLGPNALSLGCLKSLSGQVRARPVIGNSKTCKSLAPLARIFELTKLGNRRSLSATTSQILSRENYFCYHIIT